MARTKLRNHQANSIKSNPRKPDVKKARRLSNKAARAEINHNMSLGSKGYSFNDAGLLHSRLKALSQGTA